jgi:hypothetical protein
VRYTRCLPENANPIVNHVDVLANVLCPLLHLVCNVRSNAQMSENAWMSTKGHGVSETVVARMSLGLTHGGPHAVGVRAWAFQRPAHAHPHTECIALVTQR